MSREIWQEKAHRLRSDLENLNSTLIDGFVDSPKHRQELEEATIERFLRREFSDEPPEDTATFPLFSSEQNARR
jgi:hypothetical protein